MGGSGCAQCFEVGSQPALLSSGGVPVHRAGRGDLVQDRAELAELLLGNLDVLGTDGFAKGAGLKTDALLAPLVSGMALLVLAHALLG